jgi:hypothetical protein
VTRQFVCMCPIWQCHVRQFVCANFGSATYGLLAVIRQVIWLCQIDSVTYGSLAVLNSEFNILEVQRTYGRLAVPTLSVPYARSEILQWHVRYSMPVPNLAVPRTVVWL